MTFPLLGPAMHRNRHLALALGLPMALHGLYDFPLMWLDRAAGDASPALPWVWLPLATLAIGWRLALKQLHELRRDQHLAAGLPEPLHVPRPPRRWAVLLQLGLGGLLAWGGGLMTLAVLAGVALGEAAVDTTALVVGTVAVGVVPLLVGLWLYSRGLRASTAMRPA